MAIFRRRHSSSRKKPPSRQPPPGPQLSPRAPGAAFLASNMSHVALAQMTTCLPVAGSSGLANGRVPRAARVVSARPSRVVVPLTSRLPRDVRAHDASERWRSSPVIHDKHGKNTLDDLDGDLEDIFDEGELTTISKGGASVDDDDADEGASNFVVQPPREEPEEDRIVIGGPVTDAFSGLVLAMRAKGHGETSTGDGGTSGPGGISSYSSFSNPKPWSTFANMNAYEVTNCLGDVRRTLKAYAAHAAPAGALNERLMGAVGAAWLETRDVASKDDALPGVGKSKAFVWGGGEKFATLLNDTCVHRVLFRDEPTAAGNRLVADTLMTLQDLATARVPLSADATNVALAACAAIAEHVAGSDFAGPACDRLKASAPPPSEGALEVVRRGGLRLVGRTGYPKEKDRTSNDSYGRDRKNYDNFNERSGFDRPARFEPGAGQERKTGDWDCPDCGFMNFASRSECFKCGTGGGGGGNSVGSDRQFGRQNSFDLRDQKPRYDEGGRENRDGFELRPGDWKCPSCAFSNFASRSECKRCGEQGGGGGGGGGGGWDRDTSGGGDRGSFSSDRGFDRGAQSRDRPSYGRSAFEGGGGYGGGRGRGGGGRGGRGGGRGRGRGDVGGRGRSRDDFGGDRGGGGGWDQRTGDDFGAY